MKFSDFFQQPFKVTYFGLWMLYGMITIVPGTFLWLLTLGGFRYFHVSGKVANWLVDQHIKKYGSYDC